MYADLFSADLFEYQNIFESEIATSVFVYATATLLLVSASAALLSGLLVPAPGKRKKRNRREGPGWAMPH